MRFMLSDDPDSSEAVRLAALDGYDVLDTPPEVVFDELARMAASICGTPIALVSLVDGRRQWFKARHGLDVSETPREMAFCAHAIKHAAPLIINDASADARFAENPLVTGDPHIRFYAGAPLITQSGEKLGTLCVIDRQARELANEKVEALRMLSRHVVAQLELRKRLQDLSRSFSNRAREMDAVVDAQKGQIERLVNFHPKTGLGNRDFFQKSIDEQLFCGAGAPRRGAVFVVELQRFDLLSDSLEGIVVDEMLAEIARRLVRVVGVRDNVAHIRDERFGIVVPGVRTATGAALFAETSLLPALNSPFSVAGQPFPPTFKVGIAIVPADGADAETVIRAAKTALVTAKSAAEPLAFATPEVAAKVAGALSLEMKLRRALEREQFVLHYQPKVDLASGAVTGVEALLRWADPDARVRAVDDSKLVPPARFIPLLEETGLIVPVGEWVIERAKADHADWLARGVNAPRIAVNVSTLQLQHKEFLTRALRILGAGVSSIDIEITEALFLNRTVEAITWLQQLRAHGARVAIDDFGTGYSSLRYLADLPIDVLKIDRSFVSAMTSRPKDAAIVSSIIGLARGLQLKTVAEGVETATESALLRECGCDEMQGNLFSKPLPAEDLIALLALDRR